MRITASIFASQLIEISESTRNVMLGSVRPYPRSMIESVSTTLPQEFAKTSETCDISQSLKATGSIGNSVFMERQKSFTLEFVTDSRVYLQALEYESRKDDMRVAFSMREAWADSILAELQQVQGKLQERSGQIAKETTAVASLKSSGGLTNPALDVTEGRNMVKETEMGSVERAAIHGNGARLNTQAGWESLEAHHGNAKGTVDAIVSSIDTIGTESVQLLNEHIRFVAADTRYQLKWPSMIPAETISSMHEEKPAWKNAAQSFPFDFTLSLDKQVADSMKGVSATKPSSEVSRPAASDSYSVDLVEKTLEMISKAISEQQAPPVDEPGGTSKTGSQAETSTSDSTEPSFSKRMSVLNAKLNWLNSLRLGNEDAQNSLLHLITQVREKLGGLVATITTSLDAIKSGLNTIDKGEESIWKVYEDAEIFTSDASSETPEFQAALDQLSQAIGKKNNHESLPGRTKYIVNTLKIMHGNLVALVDAHSETLPEKVVGGGLDPIQTTILTIAPTTSSDGSAATFFKELQDVPAAFTRPLEFDPKPLKTKLETLSANAKETSMCILYGRVDGAQVFDVLTIPAASDICTNAQAYGQAVLKRKIGEHKAAQTSP